jgi:predicted ester cyclase
MSDDNKRAARRIPLEAFNDGKLEVIDETIAPDFIEHQPLPPGVPSGREGIKMLIGEMRKAFPDFKYTVEREIGEGDTIVQHLKASGTMKGDFMNMKASGKHAEWDEIHIARMQNGMAKEHWAVIDQMSMSQQLGFIPSPEEMAKAA